MKKNDKWTDAEEAIVREVYPAGGSRAVRALLPHRTSGSVTKIANRVGIRREVPLAAEVIQSWPGRSKANDYLDVVAREWRAANAGIFLPSVGVRCGVA